MPAVSWPWDPAWGSLEPPRRGGENAQKTGKNAGEMGEIRSKTREQGRDRRDYLHVLDIPGLEHHHSRLVARRHHLRHIRFRRRLEFAFGAALEAERAHAGKADRRLFGVDRMECPFVPHLLTNITN